MNELIAKLNKEFDTLGEYTIESLEAVAENNGLEEVYESGAVRIYKTGDGKFINAWIDEDFGSDMGFDDNTEWYTDNDTEAYPEY